MSRYQPRIPTALALGVCQNSMQNDPADIFHCEETGSDYIPAQNQLFIWKGGVA